MSGNLHSDILLGRRLRHAACRLLVGVRSDYNTRYGPALERVSAPRRVCSHMIVQRMWLRRAEVEFSRDQEP